MWPQITRNVRKSQLVWFHTNISRGRIIIANQVLFCIKIWKHCLAWNYITRWLENIQYPDIQVAMTTFAWYRKGARKDKPHIGKRFTLSEWAGGPEDSHINSIQQLKDQLLFVFVADVDECTASSPVCDKNAKCENTLNSYNCSCNYGYRGDGKTCQGERRTMTYEELWPLA